VSADGYGFQIEMTYRAKRAGASIIEVPISFTDRELGESKMSRAIVVEALWLVTKWALERPFGRGAH
jgi:dolichol-phosphate mannosyltransferase